MEKQQNLENFDQYLMNLINEDIQNWKIQKSHWQQAVLVEDLKSINYGKRQPA